LVGPGQPNPDVRSRSRLHRFGHIETDVSSFWHPSHFAISAFRKEKCIMVSLTKTNRVPETPREKPPWKRPRFFGTETKLRTKRHTLMWTTLQSGKPNTRSTGWCAQKKRSPHHRRDEVTGPAYAKLALYGPPPTTCSAAKNIRWAQGFAITRLQYCGLHRVAKAPREVGGLARAYLAPRAWKQPLRPGVYVQFGRTASGIRPKTRTWPTAQEVSLEDFLVGMTQVPRKEHRSKLNDSGPMECSEGRFFRSQRGPSYALEEALPPHPTPTTQKSPPAARGRRIKSGTARAQAGAERGSAKGAAAHPPRRRRLCRQWTRSIQREAIAAAIKMSNSTHLTGRNPTD